MADRKPPKQATGERETLLGLLQYHRDSVVRKVQGITEDQARWSPVPSGTSLLWLVRHLTMAEALWLLHRFADQPADVVPSDRLAEGDSIDDAVAAYRATWSQVGEVVAAAQLEDLCRSSTVTPPTNLRWVLAHLLEETARHAGHADVVREQIDGQVGR